MSHEAPGSLAEKLNRLFATVRPDGGHEYSNEQVAAAIRETGVHISQSYIWQLRKERKTNPTLRHLQALADFFGVPAAYFFDDRVTERVEGQLEALVAEQNRMAEMVENGDVKLMAMRAGELSPTRRKQVMELLDVVYKLEQAEKMEQVERRGTEDV
ncbi:helix-turn-helix domain-containing protein [Streptomyces afghaniensis]|uniref:helix-turn-helix domain-containing protein n=1 Tax=Streptomyces afghaniensis TaxID=66865 RepID=UPI002789BEA8|nr:helix-turn-helix transcriptional regulator [Streptomyces afghaniensis]MDQ1018108.1 transcriptional regulator with XRE-family HTH domain [Streptomyces afghaniensis]